MAFVDPNTIHNPATGTAPPATWGDQVRDNDMYLYERGPYICTAATRPGSPFEGQLIYQTDTNTYLSYDGAAWWTVGRATSAATSYSPTLTQLGTVATATTLGEYSISDGWCEFTFVLTCNGVGGSGTNAVLVSLPVTALAAATRPVGSGMIYDDSIPNRYGGIWALQSTTTIGFIAVEQAGAPSYFGVDPVNGLTSGCQVYGSVRYRIATAA